MEIAEFGLGELERTGLALVVYVTQIAIAPKELVLLPRQTCPEHLHPPVAGESGKMETFRCRRGTVWLYVEGERSAEIHAHIPPGSEAYYTVFTRSH